MSLLLAVAAQAQTLPTIPVPADITVNTGGVVPVITAPDANTLDIDLKASRTVINWASFDVGAADAVNFHFEQGSDIVLNKSTTAVTVAAGGQVTGDVGGVTGGNIWFYSPGGMVISPGAVMSAGSFVFARGDAIVDMDFADAVSPMSFLRAASDSLLQITTITTATDASISATGDLVLSAATGDIDATTVLGAGSVTVTADAGSITLGEVTAGTTAAVTATAGGVTVGALNGVDGVTATAALDVSVTSASANSATGDIVLTSGTSASLGAATDVRDVKVLGPAASLGSATAGRDVFVTATSGTAAVSGAVSAGDDVEVTATTGDVSVTGSLISAGTGADDGHVLAKSTAGAASVNSATTQGAAEAGDITIQGATTASLGSGASSQDLKVLGPSATLGSGAATRDVFVTATTGPASVTGAVTAADDIEVTATTGDVSVTGSLTSNGTTADEGHVLAKSTGGSVSVNMAATKGTGAKVGDVTIDGAVSASLGSGDASKDIKVLGPTASLGSGLAGGDVFVTATTGPASVTGAVSAGDDIEVTTATGDVSVTGSLTSNGTGADDGHVLAKSTTKSVTVSSATTLGTGAKAGDVTVEAATTASLSSGGSSQDIKVTGPTASLGAATAARDIFVTATTGLASVSGPASAGDDVEVTATTGSVLVSLTGSVTSTGAGADDGHVLAKSTGGSVSVTTATTQGTGAAAGDITVEGATTAILYSGTSSQDIKVLGPEASLASGTAVRDVFVTATTGPASVTGTVSAGDDIEVTATAGDVSVSGAVTSTGDGADDGHVLAQSTGGAVSVNSATTQGTGAAAGDITVEGATTASLTSGTSRRDIKVLGPAASLGSGSARRDVFVTATTGVAEVTGTVSARDDVEVTSAGAVSVTGSVTSTGQGAADDAHVLVRSTGSSVTVASASTQGTGAAVGDVTVEGATMATLTSGASSQNINVLGPTATLGAATASGDIFVTGTTGASVTGTAAAGDDVEVTASGAVTVTGALMSVGTGADDGHVLARSTGGSVTVSSASTHGTGGAAGDVVIDSVTTATLTSGGSTRDITVLGPMASLGAATAARDIFVTGTTGASVTGAAMAGDDIEVTATGAVAVTGGLTSMGTGADDGHVLARSTAGAAAVNSATTQGTGAAAGDVMVEGATTATLTAGSSSRDIRVLGSMASLGTVSATRDIFVTGTTGASVTGDATAGDDIEVTATTGPVSVTGSLTSTGTGADDGHVLAQSTSGSVTVASATTQGTGAAAGDITVDGTTTASLTSGDSSRDIRVSGPTATLASGTADRDVFVTGTTGASVTGAVSARDDIEVTATGSVSVSGSLTSTGAGAPDDAHVLVKSTSGSVTVDSAATQGTGARVGDVTLDAATTLTLDGTVSATRDVQLLAGDAVLAGNSTISARGDVAARSTSSNVTIGSASAGDDVALRALAGFVRANGDVEAGQTRVAGDPDPSGAADTLVGATLAGHDLDIKAQTVTVVGDAAAGRAPDVGETLGAAQLASDVIVTATNPDAGGGVFALRLATGAGKSVTAHQDINLRAENTAGGGVRTGDVSAGRDVAVYSSDANILMRSTLAGDDIVLRAPRGSIEVTGDVKAGRDSPGMTPSDAVGAADVLNTALPFLDFDGNPATIFSVVGFDVNIVGQSIRITGDTVAGRQPSTDDPDTAGAIDTTTSDVRLGTRLSMTPVVGLAPNIELGSVTATRDLQIDSAKAVTADDLSAGRDIAVLGRGGVTPGAAAGDHAGSGVTLNSARAGDDTLAFSIYGRTNILGGATSGLPFARLAPTNDRLIDGATEAADQLAIYLRYFDLDDASAPYVLPGAALHIAGEGVTVGGALAAHGAGSDVRVRSSLDIDVTGATTADGLAVFQTDAGTGGTVKVAAVTAREILLDGGGSGLTGAEATGTLTSTAGDVAVRSRDGKAIELAGVAAGDDVVLRTTGQVTVSGTLTTGGAADGAGLGDALRTSDGSVTVEGQAFDLTAHDVDILAGSVTTIGNINAAGGGSDVRVQATGAISLGRATARRDVLVDGGAAVSTGVLNADRDVGVRSTGAASTVTVGGAVAGDDVVIRAKGAIDATGALTSGGGTDSAAADQAGDLLFGAAKSALTGDLDLTGRNVDVRSSAGSIAVTAAVTADADARFQTEISTGGSVKVAAVTAGRDVLLDGGAGAGANGAEATGTLTSTAGDVAVRARDGKDIKLAGVAAGDDLVLRGTGGANLTGAVTANGGTDGAGLGDVLMASAGAVTVEGQAFDLTGHDVDIRTGSVTATGNITAVGAASDVRVQSTAVATLGVATAGRDVLVDAGGAVTTALLTAARDVGVRSTGVGSTVAVGGAMAGDDVVLRAKGAIGVTGLLTAGGGTDSAAGDQAGDLIFGAAKSRLAGDLDLVGRTVDIRSSAGSIEITGMVSAATDARVQTQGSTGGSVKVGAVTAARDVLLDGGAGAGGANGAEATGTLTATDGDVAVRARDAKAIKLAAITAGDDAVLRATGGIQTSGMVSTMGRSSAVGLGDRLSDGTEGGALVVGGMSFGLDGSDVDVVGDMVDVFKTNAMGSARVKAGIASIQGGANAGIDILIDSGASLTVGDLTALGDISLRSRTGSLTVGRLTAGDDIVLRAALGISAMSLKVDGVERIGVGDQLFASDPSGLGEDFDVQGNTIDVKSAGGAISIANAEATGDVRLQATGDVGVSGALIAGRDLFLDGGSVTATGGLSAGGDVAIYGRVGAVSLGSVSAGDDIVVRATGDVSSSGELRFGLGAAVNGIGDRLVTATGPVSLFGGETDLDGGVMDLRGGSIRLGGPIAAEGTNAHLRLKSTGATILGDATLTGDISIDAGGDVTAGAVSARRDIAIRSSAGGIAIASATAGDDIVLRANRAIAVTGRLSTGLGADAGGAADGLFDTSRTALGGDLDLVGQTIDLASETSDVTVTGALAAAGDARLRSATGRVTASDLKAGRDVLVDAGSVDARAVEAGRDIAIRASADTLTLGSATAGDDLVLRASGDIRVTGTVSATGGADGGPDGEGTGDRLLRTGLGGVPDLAGRNIDLQSTAGGITTAGAVTATDDIRLQAAGGVVTEGEISAGRDVLLGGGSLTAGVLKAGRTIDLASTTSGIATQGALTAGQDIRLKAAGAVITGSAVTAGRDVLLDGGSVETGTVNATRDITVRAATGGLKLASAAAGRSIDLKSTAAGITTQGSVVASEDISLQAAGTVVTGSEVIAGRDVLVEGGAVEAGALKAGRDIAVRASAGALKLTSAAAGRTVALTSTAAGITTTGSVTATENVSLQAAGSVVTGGDIAAGQDVLVDGGSVETGAVKAGRDVAIRASAGGLKLASAAAGRTVALTSATAGITTQGSVTATQDVRLQAAGDVVTAGAVTGGRDVLVEGGMVTVGAVTAGRTIDLKSTSAGITVRGAVTATEDVRLKAAAAVMTDGEITAGRDVLVEGASVTARALKAGRTLDVTSTSAGLATQGAITAAEDIRLRAAGALTTGGEINAGRDVLLDGGSVDAGAVKAGRDIAIRAATGALRLGSAAAGDDLVLRAAMAITVTGAATAGGGADGDGEGDRLFATDRTALAGDLGLAGANIDLRSRGSIVVSGTATASGDTRFQTVGDGAIDLANVTAGGDILADGRTVRATGRLAASRDVAVRARGGAVELAAVSAGDDIAIRASASVKATGALASGTGANASGAADRLVSAGEGGMIMRLVDPMADKVAIEGFALGAGDIDIRSGEAISLTGDVTAAGASSLRLQAAGKITVATATAGETIFARGADLSLDGAWRAKLVRLEVTTSGLALGEGVTAPSGGLALSSRLIGMIDAPTLQIFLGDSSGAMRGSALAIGALAIDVAKIRTSLELYAGPLAEVAISGAFAPSSTATNTTTIRIGAPNAGMADWAPKTIKVIANNGGSIGTSATTTGRTFTDVKAFGSVELNAVGDILIGYQDFIDKLAMTPAASVAAAVKSIIAPQAVGGPRMLITAGTLTLRADGKVAQQDTAGLLGSTPTGLYLLGAASGPQLVLGRTSVAPGGSRLPDYIELNGALTQGSTAMTGQSVSLLNVIVFDSGVSANAYYRLNGCAIMQQGSCTPSTGVANISIAPDQLTGLTIEDHTAAAGTADPTVASATNEEVWKDPD